MEGIGKLIELLNEYCEPMGYYYNDDDLQGQTKARVLSKEYGFIKWLVDNDKIELHELSKKELATGWNLENNILDEDNTKESWIKFWTENLLMLLAIQDSPIEFLCSIIK